MKKNEKLLFLGVMGVAIILGIGMVLLNNKLNANNNSLEDDNVSDNPQSSTKLYYELEDRYIYTHDLDSILFTFNNETKELKEWFKSDKDFLNKFLNELELDTGFNDGGTVVLDGGTQVFNVEDIVVIVCKRIDMANGYNNNIHIGKDLKYENDVCYKEIKK